MSIEIIETRRVGDRLETALSDPDLAALVERQQVVCLRGGFAGDEMLGLRQRLGAWAASTPVFPPGQSASRAGHNFHRVDDQSQPSELDHMFHVYGFGDFPALPSDLRAGVESVGASLLGLQNRLAGTAFDFRSGEVKLGVLRHPKGGGFLANHRHPYLPQKFSLFLNLSRPGTDYTEGEARFRREEGWLGTFDDFRLGDILAWRYDLIHSVSAVDPTATVDWSGDDGLWILAPELIETHRQSKAA